MYLLVVVACLVVHGALTVAGHLLTLVTSHAAAGRRQVQPRGGDAATYPSASYPVAPYLAASCPVLDVDGRAATDQHEAEAAVVCAGTRAFSTGSPARQSEHTCTVLVHVNR